MMTGLVRWILPAGAYMALHAVQQIEQSSKRSHDAPEILQVIFIYCDRSQTGSSHQHTCTTR